MYPATEDGSRHIYEDEDHVMYRMTEHGRDVLSTLEGRVAVAIGFILIRITISG